MNVPADNLDILVSVLQIYRYEQLYLSINQQK